MFKKLLLAFLISILLIVGFLLPNGIKTALVNNIWSVRFIKQNYTEFQPEIENVPPESVNSHAGLLLANKALKMDDLPLAVHYITPLVDDPHPVTQDTYAEILYLQGDYPAAIQTWEKIGNITSLVYAGGELNINGQSDLVSIAVQSLYTLKPHVYTKSWVSVLRELQNYEMAVAVLKNSIQSYPDAPQLSEWQKLLQEITDQMQQ